MSVSLRPTLKYDLNWAQSVVNQALEKHSRVSESFLEFMGMDRKTLALLLARGRPEWALLRDMLKTGDKWAWKQESLGIDFWNEGTIQMWGTIIEWKRQNYPQNLRTYLDKQYKLLNS